MAEGYYQHLWEGFPGSHLLLYDPETGILENRGIPAPHETLYGGHLRPAAPRVLLRRHDPGHAYACSLDDNRVTDLGQVTEFGAYRWVTGPTATSIPPAGRGGCSASGRIPGRWRSWESHSPVPLPGFSDPQPAQRRENRAGRAAVHAGGVGGLPVRLRLRPKPAGQSGQLRARRAEMAP